MTREVCDVEYTSDTNENKDDKHIRGKALYYSTSQVANLLGESDSKIRYYSNVFQDIICVEMVNKQRRYTEDDIEKLRFIVSLKEEGMTIKQIQEYCQDIDFKETKEGVQIKDPNPLKIKALVMQLMEEQMKQMELFEGRIMDKVRAELKNSNEEVRQNVEKVSEKIRQEVAITVDEIISEKQMLFTDTVSGLITDLKNDNEEIKEFIRTTTRVEKKEQEKVNSFWHRAFGWGRSK
jgi:DNA-binding transcriptional MerR regulator